MSELFSYESVDEDTAEKLAYFAERGHKLVQANQIRFIAEMGQLLSEARDALADHYRGTFIKWATSEFDVSKRTVHNYVNAWDRLLCNGYQKYRHLSPTAIYLLIGDDTPKQVQKRVEHLAAQQEPVRRSDIQELIDAVQPNLRGATVAQHSAKPQESDRSSSGPPQSPAQTANADQHAAFEHEPEPETQPEPPELFVAVRQRRTMAESGPDPELIRKQLQAMCEKVRRQFHDLNDLEPHSCIDDADGLCVQLIQMSKEWLL